MVREDGAWYYKITTDPNCESTFKFFHLGTPIPEVTPVSEGNPNCDPAYPLTCIAPYPPDLDCSDIKFRNFVVWPPDPHGFDPDDDGLGCEK
jgi:hypothetical protein